MALPKSSETATRILQAAYRRLATDGYARLNMRDVAAEAGINHALIHYYFGSKDQLVIAVLDEANRRLLERQTQPLVIHEKKCPIFEDRTARVATELVQDESRRCL